ncbi:MAG: hypothetical protein HOE30_00035 [Deltaproteobacteria bacterium]|nr:hypothetical protein [Deltaproteobacteria bacterium]
MDIFADNFLSWRQLLGQIISDLDTLTQQSEKIFQAFATSPEKIKKSNDDCATSAVLVIQRIEEQQGLDLSVFGDFHSSISASVNSTLSDITGSLRSLMAKVTEIQDLKSTLEEVSYSIKNVSLLMKIKTTKMGKSEFDHVVKGLESLARQIKENTEGINASTQEVSENITLTCEQVDDRLSRFNRLIKPSREQMEELLEMFGDIALITQNKCKQIKTLSDQSRQKIELLQKTAAMQAQFLTEMQVVRQALNGAVSILSLETNDEVEGHKVMQQVVGTITQQIKQITKWNHELETAGNMLLENLKHLLQTAEEQIDEATTMAESVSASREKMVGFENDFNSISTTTSFSEEKTRELLEAISSINDNVYNVSRQVSQIDIGRNDLEALTYNAVFKAAKVGMQGKVMESITDEITGLSREVQAKVTDKEAVIKSIVASSKEFKGSLSEKLNQQLNFSKEINLKIREQSRMFFDDVESVTAVLEKAKQLGETLNQSLSDELFEQRLNDPLKKIHTRMSDILVEMQQHSVQPVTSP